MYPTNTITELCELVMVKVVLSVIASKLAPSITASRLNCYCQWWVKTIYCFVLWISDWGFVFCLCSLTSFPAPRPTVRSNPTRSRARDRSLKSQWSSYWH